MTTCSASGPGRRWQKLSARTNSSSLIHFRRSTSWRCMRPIWPTGPPNASQPSLRKYQKISDIETRSAERRCDQRVEVRDGVGLGPDAHLAGIPERVVLGVDDGLSFPEDLQAIPAGLDRERVPGLRSHLAARPLDLSAAPVHHAVQVDVVLERVGARDVVVVGIAVPEDEPA